MSEDDEISSKELGGNLEQVSREEWANQHLYWDKDQQAWWIPGTSYRLKQPGSVPHANHVAMLRMFPWLEENDNEEDFGLYLDKEHLNWMPLWNPFKKFCKMCDKFEVIDEDAKEEVNRQAIEQAWKDGYAKETFDLLAEKFGNQFKNPGWQTELENFLLSSRGLDWYSSRAHDSDQYWDNWDTEGISAPTTFPYLVVPNIAWEDLRSAVYPNTDKDQLRLPFSKDPDPQLDLPMQEAEEDSEMADFMKDINRSTPERIKAFMDEHFTFDEANQVWEMEGFCNFGGSLINRANCEAFQERYPNLVRTVHGDMGSQTVGIRERDLKNMDASALDSLATDLQTISEDAILDDEIYYRLESELRQEAWDGWIQKEFLYALRERLPDLAEAIDDKADDPRFRALFEDARDSAGEEWIEEQDRGGKQYAHVGKIAAAVTPEMVQQWLLGQIGEDYDPIENPKPKKRKYSVVMAPAPPELADAVIRWGEMMIPEDKLYLDPEHKDGFGREKEIHVTVKFGLHEPEPSGELLDIIEQSQPFEIEIGPVSLFENPKFDVVKLGVGGEALKALNKRISQLENSDEHPNYEPHMTVAYVIKGTCNDLVGKPLFDASEPGAVRFVVKAVEFKGASEEKIHLFLGKPNLELA